MSMSDWDDKANGGRMTLSSVEKYSGYKSLKILQLEGNYLIKILKQSETDLPKSVMFDFYLGRYYWNYAQISFFFRYQDVNNFYSLIITSDSVARTIRLYKVENGGESYSYSTCNLGMAKNTWAHFKINMCEISGTIYALLWKDTGTWTLLKQLTKSGAIPWATGAVGVGMMHPNYGSSQLYVYLDETKIYY